MYNVTFFGLYSLSTLLSIFMTTILFFQLFVSTMLHYFILIIYVIVFP